MSTWVEHNGERVLLETVKGRGGAAIKFNPSLHPRNRQGEFAKVLGGLKVGQSAELPDGTSVTRQDDRFVIRGGQFSSPRSASSAKGAAGQWDRMQKEKERRSAARGPNVTPKRTGTSSEDVAARRAPKDTTRKSGVAIKFQANPNGTHSSYTVHGPDGGLHSEAIADRPHAETAKRAEAAAKDAEAYYASKGGPKKKGRAKIQGETLSRMEKAISSLDTPERRASYLAGNFPRADKTKDLDKRYRWDLLHASGFPTTSLYDEGASDTHIDTALRSIVKPLDKRDKTERKKATLEFLAGDADEKLGQVIDRFSHSGPGGNDAMPAEVKAALLAIKPGQSANVGGIPVRRQDDGGWDVDGDKNLRSPWVAMQSLKDARAQKRETGSSKAGQDAGTTPEVTAEQAAARRANLDAIRKTDRRMVKSGREQVKKAQAEAKKPTTARERADAREISRLNPGGNASGARKNLDALLAATKSTYDKERGSSPAPQDDIKIEPGKTKGRHGLFRYTVSGPGIHDIDVEVTGQQPRATWTREGDMNFRINAREVDWYEAQDVLQDLLSGNDAYALPDSKKRTWADFPNPGQKKLFEGARMAQSRWVERDGVRMLVEAGTGKCPMPHDKMKAKGKKKCPNCKGNLETAAEREAEKDIEEANCHADHSALLEKGEKECAKCKVKLKRPRTERPPGHHGGPAALAEALALIESLDLDAVDLDGLDDEDRALIAEAADSMRKATQHKHGLEVKKGKADNWVERTGAGGKGGQLPAYIQHIALAIEKKGKAKSQAIAIAIGTVKRWAAGGGKVDANTRAAATKALSEWTAMKAKAHAA